MYKKSEKACPQCFRTLRMRSNEQGVYCPDTWRCQWQSEKGAGSVKPTFEHLEEGLQKALQEKDMARVKRIKSLLILHHPTGLADYAAMIP